MKPSNKTYVVKTVDNFGFGDHVHYKEFPCKEFAMIYARKEHKNDSNYGVEIFEKIGVKL